GVQSSASLPCRMSHRSVPATDRPDGLADYLVRLSVGIEDVRDLQDDLAQAFAVAAAPAAVPTAAAAAAGGDRHAG
ncbi:MAG: PLP-dependent transferase, partial [Planctomycetota bacterium]